MDLQRFITTRLEELKKQDRRLTAAELCRQATEAGYPIKRQRLSQIKISGVSEIIPETLEAVARALRVDVETIAMLALRSVGLPLRVRPIGPVAVRARCLSCDAPSSEPGELIVVIETTNIAERDLGELVRRIEEVVGQEHERLARSAESDHTSTAG